MSIDGVLAATMTYCTAAACPLTTDGKPEEWLERVTYPDGSYERYVYDNVALDANSNRKRRLLWYTLTPRDTFAASPDLHVVPQTFERIREQHEYRTYDFRAKRSRGEVDDFGYGSPGYAGSPITQYDLHSAKLVSGAKVACTADSQCDPGGATPQYGCWLASSPTKGDGYCYRKKVITLDTAKARSTSYVTSGSSSNGGGTRSWAYSTNEPNYPSKVVDQSGLRTTYSYDSMQRPTCIVENDNNDIAGNPPSCDAPASGAKVTAFSYSGNSVTITRKSLISGTT